MWTRKELKDRAKAVLKLNYWRAVLVALILTFVSGGGSGSTGSSSNISTNISGNNGSINEGFNFSGNSAISDAVDTTAFAAVIAAVIVVFIIVFALMMALSVFVFNPLVVGCQRFFIRCRSGEAKIGDVTYAFSHSYLNVVKITFLEGLYLFLWTLLLIVPGIIKAYEYKMIPYILAENPEMDSKAVFARTREMMMGDKWNTFVLGLSFLGWQLLGVLTCCILNVFYVNPYVYLTYAELYAVLKQKVDGPSSTFSTYYDGNDGQFNPYQGNAQDNPYIQY